jgi:23S rRNA pseudouridine955/2504/2580 synthase
VKPIIGANPPDDAAQTKTLRVEEDDAGQRLDNFLMRHLKGVPKTHMYRIIRSGEVRINKGRAARSAGSWPATWCACRRCVPRSARNPRRMPWPSGSSSGSGRCAGREFPVLFEDDWLLAIDKPAGVAVHGGSGVSFGVIEQLRMARPQAHFLELVHRLDRETSGILLVAKKRSALKHLQDQFRERETGKTYLALVAGVWPARLKVLDKSLRKYLLPDGERRVQVVTQGPPGRRWPSLTLVKATRPWPALGPSLRSSVCSCTPGVCAASIR